MTANPSPRPAPSLSLHQRILADIESRILSGEWPPGHRIPFEHELTARYQCSRMTVSKALTQLASAGLIERRRKAGSFVTRPHSQSAVLEIQDVRAEVAALGLPYRFAILSRRKRRATRADRALFGVGPGDLVLALTCRHDAAQRPFCLEERLINLSAAPEAADEPFAETSPGAWLMRRVPWTRAEHRISAAGARADAGRALKIAAGAPCLVIERRTWSGEAPVTRVKLTYPGEAHELVARFTPGQS
ncbi:MAG: histidine utilization repressor [Roseiarcus sp.]|jgi:GntR family histidine utilization transcriptional repressor